MTCGGPAVGLGAGSYSSRRSFKGIAARDGNPVTALELAGAALNHERRSQPSLLLVASEVAHELEYRSPADGAEFRSHLRALSAPDGPRS